VVQNLLYFFPLRIFFFTEKDKEIFFSFPQIFFPSSYTIDGHISGIHVKSENVRMKLAC